MFLSKTKITITLAGISTLLASCTGHIDPSSPPLYSVPKTHVPVSCEIGLHHIPSRSESGTVGCVFYRFSGQYRTTTRHTDLISHHTRLAQDFCTSLQGLTQPGEPNNTLWTRFRTTDDTCTLTQPVTGYCTKEDEPTTHSDGVTDVRYFVAQLRLSSVTAARDLCEQSLQGHFSESVPQE